MSEHDLASFFTSNNEVVEVHDVGIDTAPSSTSCTTLGVEPSAYSIPTELEVDMNPLVCESQDITHNRDSKPVDSWITFNILCLKKEKNIDIDIKKYPEEHLLKDFFFFETEMFNFLKKKEHSVAVQEGGEKCPVCSSNKIISFQTQDRSADEAMTNNFECTKCGNRWRN